MPTPTKYPFAIHQGSRKDAGLLNRAATVGAAKRAARSESQMMKAQPFSVFNEDGICLALYQDGELVKSWKPDSKE
jgi:hypothetical protein